MRRLSHVIAVLALTAFSAAHAQQPTATSRPVAQVYMLETGSSAALDTYLSPLRYHGFGTSLCGIWTKAMPQNPGHLNMRFDGRIDFESMKKPYSSARMYGFSVAADWGMTWRDKLPCALQISLGGDVGVEGGALYMPHNGNNPAAASLWGGLSLRAEAAYPIKIGKLPVLLSESVRLPSAGAFFSPEYAEPYYEIYLGNTAGLAHFGWWGNHFCIDNLVSADLDIGPAALRLGYRFRVSSSWVNSINHQVVTHSFVIGVIPDGIGLKKKKPSEKTLTINALY